MAWFLFIGGILIVVFCLILYLSIQILKYIISKKHTKKGKVILILLGLLTLFIGYGIYKVIYPGDGFYRRNFKEIAGYDLPTNAKIIKKDASSSDLQGKFEADFTMVFDPETYNSFYQRIHRDTTFHCPRDKTYANESMSVSSNSANSSTPNPGKFR